MKNMNLGQNLKKIRKDLNLKQRDIAGEDVTRNLISLMENNKTPIYHNVANIISKNINAILAKRGEDIYIQAEDILNPERYESRAKANEYINILRKHLEEKNYDLETEKLNEIENFLNKWNFIDKKVKIYELLGDIFYNAKDLNREYYYYIKALEVSYEYPNMKERYKLILKLVYNCIVTKKYQEAIRLCDFAITTQEDITEKYKGIFHYNSALSYYYLGDYYKALDHIIYAKFYIAFDDYREIKRILMLEGICNTKIDNYDGAIRNYNKALEMINKENVEEMCLLYINFLQIYADKNEREKVIEYLNNILEYVPKIDKNSFCSVHVFLSMAKTYKYLGDLNSYEEYLNKTLTVAYENKDNYSFGQVVSLLMDLYIENDNYEKIESLIKKYEKDIKNFSINDSFAVILKSIYCFIDQDKNWEAKYFIKTILEKGEV